MKARILIGACAMASLTLTEAAAQTAQTPPADLVSAVRAGTPILEFRPRYESVDQDGIASADALTLRSRLGWQTAKWRNLQALIEFEDVRALSGDYNDGVPPAEPYATIGDPEVTELNRLQLVWTPTQHVTATIGRQRIGLDDQRFIGTAAWRQDEQTFDAIRFDGDFGRFDLTYAYLDHINRVFAEDLDWESESHLLNASYTFSDALKLTGFVYALDFTNPATAAVANNSNLTAGIRATGRHPAGPVTLAYSASFARQSDYGESLVDYEADYVAAELSATYQRVTLRAAYESLEGEGANRRFQTPLASLHPFQGWADVFGATPADGIDDLNAGITWRPEWRAEHFSNIELTARYHDFEAERTGADLGSEIDLSASAQITRQLSLLLKFADYDGPGATPEDRTKIWAGVEFRL